MTALTVEAVLARSLWAHALADPAGSIDEALLGAAGVYGSAPTSHLGLAARVDGYTSAQLERARLKERTILRVPGMRGSVFLAPRELAPAFLGLSRPGTVRRTLAGAGWSDAEQARWADLVERALADRPLSAREIRERLGADAPDGPVVTLILRGMAHAGRIVAAEPVGNERATAYRYARMADWVPGVEPLAKGDALAVMAPIWMRANGPGTVDDLAWWAGVTRREALSALGTMGARTVDVDGLAGEQWATDEVIDRLATAEAGGVVRLLPVWDAWLMARRDRGRLLDPAHRSYVVDRSGNVTNTITLDGRVVGTWDVEGATVLVHLFVDVPRRQLESAAERLRVLYEWVELRQVTDARPLDDGGQNAFRSPLRMP